jgi:phage terminase small subunit
MPQDPFTKEELDKKLTDKERIFCHEYIIDWNKARAARAAGYSKESAKDIGYQISTKLYIQQYIDFIKDDIEKETGITKIRQLNELAKIAYSSIAHLHNTWIELKEFEKLTDSQKEAIESIDSKTEIKSEYNPESDQKEPVTVRYIKIKLHSKTAAIAEINKMQGYNAPEKSEHSGEIKLITHEGDSEL